MGDVVSLGPADDDSDGEHGLCIGCQLQALQSIEQAVAESLEASYHGAHRISRGRLRNALDELDRLTGLLVAEVESDDDDIDDDIDDNDLIDA